MDAPLDGRWGKGNPLRSSDDTGTERAASRTTGPHHCSRRPLALPPRKIVTPIAAGAAASRSLTRPAPPRASFPSFAKMMEVGMLVEQQIEELRAELSACWSRREAKQIEAELQAAMAERDRLARAFSETIG